MDKKTLNRIGWLASAMGIAVFFSYLDQVRLNVSGHPGSVILPIITTNNWWPGLRTAGCAPPKIGPL